MNELDPSISFLSKKGPTVLLIMDGVGLGRVGAIQCGACREHSVYGSLSKK